MTCPAVLLAIVPFADRRAIKRNHWLVLLAKTSSSDSFSKAHYNSTWHAFPLRLAISQILWRSSDISRPVNFRPDEILLWTGVRGGKGVSPCGNWWWWGPWTRRSLAMADPAVSMTGLATADPPVASMILPNNAHTYIHCTYIDGQTEVDWLEDRIFQVIVVCLYLARLPLHTACVDQFVFDAQLLVLILMYFITRPILDPILYLKVVPKSCAACNK